MAIALRYAARSDVGLVRTTNQDSGYAGPHLLVVADGMGGHAGGDVASSLAIAELAPLDGESHGSDDAADHLSRAVHDAHRQLLDRVSEEPGLSGMGTTVTAMLRAGGRLALAHIGDSRAYALRDGTLVQITRDHTFVQTLVDEGRLTTEEAGQHPQRSVLMRVLSDIVDDVEPDLSVREAKIGDRYLFCSDGLSGVVSFETLQETLAQGMDPATTCDHLVQLALRAGAPDNVTCIVADVVDANDRPPDTVPAVVGAASAHQPARSTASPSAAERAAELTAPSTHATDLPAEAVAPRSRTFRLVRAGAFGLAVLALVAGGVFGAYRWSQVQFFVGTSSGSVAIFRGLPQDLGPIRLSRVDEVVSDVPVDELPSYSRQRVQRGIVADGKTAASQIVQSLRDQVEACRAAAEPTATGTAAAPVTSAATTAPTPPGTTLPPVATGSERGVPGSASLLPGGQSGPPRGEPVTPTAAVPSGQPSPTAAATATATSPSAAVATTPGTLSGLPAADCEGIG
jgi:serine/threonine protein phosphatase PrpC